MNHPASAAILERARRVTPGGVNTSIRRVEPMPVWSRAAGSKIYDVQGREYIDYHAAFGPAILGHCHPGVNRRVRETVDEIDLLGVGTTEGEIRLAEKIVQHVPSAEMALLCNTGSEATHPRCASPGLRRDAGNSSSSKGATTAGTTTSA